jgi:hypothetical protein
MAYTNLFIGVKLLELVILQQSWQNARSIRDFMASQRGGIRVTIQENNHVKIPCSLARQTINMFY